MVIGKNTNPPGYSYCLGQEAHVLFRPFALGDVIERKGYASLPAKLNLLIGACGQSFPVFPGLVSVSKSLLCIAGCMEGGDLSPL
jgi:hypothetical protein